jgi:transposase
VRVSALKIILERFKVAYTGQIAEYSEMKPYSNDLRRRIIQAIQANQETQEEIAELFSVGLSFVEKLWRRFRETGSYEALPHSGGRERLLKDDEKLIRRKVAGQADITLLELAEYVSEQTQREAVSEAVMCNELQRLNLPRKKSRSMPQKEKPSGF